MTTGNRTGLMQVARKILGQHWPIILLIVINIVIGLVMVRDYGQSWDEPGIQNYGAQALSAYGRLFRGEDPPVYESDLMYYGPVFGMLGVLAVRVLEQTSLNWLAIDYWHWVYFLTFQIDVLALYVLSRRWIGRWASFGVALIFTTQPLLWGHAFINPKDIPFLAFFLLSLLLGFRMVDKAAESNRPEEEADQALFSKKELSAEWNKTGKGRKGAAILAAIVWLSLGIFLLFFNHLVRGLVASLVTAAYEAGGEGIWGRVFTRLAPHATQSSLGGYINKALSFVSGWEVVLYIFIGLAIAFIFLKMVAPMSYGSLVNRGVKPVLRGCLDFLTKPYLYFAAVVLGLTISVRVLGPYAGLLVSLFSVWKLKWRKWLPLLITYYGMASFLSYLTWPFLWRNPVGRFLESIKVMSHFVRQGGGLVQGNLTDTIWLQKLYLPKLIALQLTEPLLILFLAGLILVLFRLKNRKNLELLVLWVFWFLLPVSWMAISGSSIYDNFRQLFFVLPPLFLLAGMALEELFSRLRKPFLNGLLLFLLTLPALYACFNLHPYEYIYYNSFVGGVKGAFRHYELDYWATSYKEAAEYLNKAAPPNAAIGVVGTDQIFKPYARPDMKVYYFNGIDPSEDFTYVVVSSRANNDLAVCPRAEGVKTIERDKAVLAVIKKVSSREECILSP